MPAGTHRHPADETQYRKAVDRRRIQPRGPVSDPDVARLALRRGLHHARDVSNDGSVIDRSQFHGKGTVKIDCTSKNGAASGNLLRRAFAGDQ